MKPSLLLALAATPPLLLALLGVDTGALIIGAGAAVVLGWYLFKAVRA
jgi:hypothetical protein